MKENGNALYLQSHHRYCRECWDHCRHRTQTLRGGKEFFIWNFVLCELRVCVMCECICVWWNDLPRNIFLRLKLKGTAWLTLLYWCVGYLAFSNSETKQRRIRRTLNVKKRNILFYEKLCGSNAAVEYKKKTGLYSIPIDAKWSCCHMHKRKRFSTSDKRQQQQ